MLVKEEMLSKLRQIFGLNLYEAKIWTALLSRGVSTAGELSEISNVPRSRAYDVLESLEKKGFIVMKLGKPIKYVAVKPSEVVERTKKLVKQHADDRVEKLNDLKGGELLEELSLLHKNGIEYIEPADLSGALRGRSNLYMHLDTMMKNAKSTVDLMTTSDGIVRKAESLKGTLLGLAKKGVKIRIATQATPESVEALKELGQFCEVRHVDKISSRFCIVDNKEMLFMLLNDREVHPSYDTGIWVTTPYFASALSDLFSHSWNDMKAVDKALKNH
ncbi:hypothetical protein HY501_00185 [Candidatus Woesearchaeota archaeon]|nr:hypothetical protein [Candidatus Woesearchaeota archaeon]